MQFKAFIAMVLIAAGPGDALASSARALCAPAQGRAMNQASCCCGPHACRTSGSSGLRSGCCDMRRLPVRDAETSGSAREGAPLTVTADLPIAALVSDCGAPSAPAGSFVLRLPDSLHAPPLYDLFRSYRI